MVDHARPLTVASASYTPYPEPLATYEEVVADRQLFMTSLEQLHSAMGTKFMIPIKGGKDLDLHKLFVEVTKRGGIEEVIREKRWKEVGSTFNFPSTATNASFALRKHYYSLLLHYERLYYQKVQGHGPQSSTGALKSFDTVPDAVTPAATSSVGTSVIGVIDGKFDSGYLVTVKMGNDTLKGALYQAPPANAQHMPQAFR